MRYLLDSSALISAARMHYHMDFCPAFWNWLGWAHGAGKVFSVGQVKRELAQGNRNDALLEWIRILPDGFFLPDANAECMRKVKEWVEQKGYPQEARDEFLHTAADFPLIAKALEMDVCVVTQEKPAPDSLKKVKIPDVCNALEVKWLPTYEMLRRERPQFVLA